MLVLTKLLPSPGKEELTNILVLPDPSPKYPKLVLNPRNCSAMRLRLPSFMTNGLSPSTWIISANTGTFVLDSMSSLPITLLFKADLPNKIAKTKAIKPSVNPPWI